MSSEIIVSFDDVSVAEANRHAADLAQLLRRTVPGVEAKQQRTDADAQDFGATLVLMLGTPALVALAKGVADWIRMRRSAKITLRDAKGNILISSDHLTSADARALIEQALAKALPAGGDA